jgi:predicted RNA binding protein YcfA (HicA-like mRNA interferase family)
VKYRDLIRQVEKVGWRLDRQKGSHLQYRHPTKPGTVTIPAGGKTGDEIPLGTLNSILKQAGLK